MLHRARKRSVLHRKSLQGFTCQTQFAIPQQQVRVYARGTCWAGVDVGKIFCASKQHKAASGVESDLVYDFDILVFHATISP